MSSVVTIGNFDGVHRGHLALVDRAIEAAGRLGLGTVALTFDPHPAAVLRPEDVPPALQSLDERVATLRAHGIDEVDVVTFDASLAGLTPDAFVADVLVARHAPAHVVVGENFRFGHRAEGGVGRLVALGLEHEFTVERPARAARHWRPGCRQQGSGAKVHARRSGRPRRRSRPDHRDPDGQRLRGRRACAAGGRGLRLLGGGR